jgi:radical SAM protein with 4Fe4S-binding SPASM domain
MSNPGHTESQSRPSGEILPGNCLFQAFRADTDYLSGISILVGTYRSIQNCHLKLSLYELSSWHIDMVRTLSNRKKLTDQTPFTERILLPKERLVAELEVCCNIIPDNTPVDLFVDPDRKSRGRLYLLKVCSPDAAHGSAVAVWLNNGAKRIDGHLWCSVGGREQEGFGVAAQLLSASPLANSPVPPGLCISTTTQCNLNCVHCISRSTRTRVNRLSSEIRSDIKRWADEGLLQSACTDYSGDILWADQRFGGDLDFFLGLNVPFHLDTNGVCLHQETSKRLMNSRVVSINVSLDAARDETLRRIRVGAPPLERLVANMRELSEERKRSGRMEVVLSISFSLMTSNIDELPEAIALSRDVGFNVVLCRHVEAYTADMVQESLWHDKTRFNDMRERAIALARELGVQLGIPEPFDFCTTRQGHTFCPEPWRSAMVLGNGDVQVCCVPGPEMRMGNLHEQTMEEIWNGTRYQQFRMAVNSKKPPAACNACPIYRVRNNPDSYMPFARTESSSLRVI